MKQCIPSGSQGSARHLPRPNLSPGAGHAARTGERQAEERKKKKERETEETEGQRKKKKEKEKERGEKQREGRETESLSVCVCVCARTRNLAPGAENAAQVGVSLCFVCP